MPTYYPRTYTGTTGVFEYTIGFAYAQADDVLVYVNDGTGWVLDTNWYFSTSGTKIKWDTPDEPDTNYLIEIRRKTDISALLVSFTSGAGLVGTDVNSALKQLLYAIDELQVPAFTTGWVTVDSIVTGAADITYLHNIGALPTRWVVQLKCTDAELGFATDDVIEATSAWPSPIVRVSATAIDLSWMVADLIQVVHQTTAVATLIDQTKWSIRVMAWA